ncbi:DNA polymerase III subunit delta [Halocynthiibacter styelae]|uniref:DNA-directed DNA polymerase n=1 Tax=Halocynthiibacter styelae TaxID=2761955 RepID=A0A8J7IK87_9RHOB|nr:DNA polymerase III subunit delta [Paenihalocynthiibacter styelae]MBI1494753.1 DNA polymerase III subunit delta [Paenihalocynthiibacter styelae]
MKLSAREATRYFAQPDPGKTGLLIYGQDAMRVALKRQQVIAALVGPKGEEEMRLTRINGAELRKDPAQLSDAVKAVGFFPGARVVFVEEATEFAFPALQTALDDWQAGDAQVVVTAKALKATSKIRKLFEGHNNSFAVGIYDDPPGREEIEGMLKKAGLADVPHDAFGVIEDLSRSLDPGDFGQVIEKLGLYKFRDNSPVTAEDIDAVAPTSTEAALDDMLNIVAEARTAEIGPLMARLRSQGVLPVTLCIGTMRHFRTLHAAASDPGGPSQGISRLRPPVFGPRRDRMTRQANTWGLRRLEQALQMLTETDLQLRSASTAPANAAMERTLIRLSMLARR